jgi:GNAT superfamily N-acetyltransferase
MSNQNPLEQSTLEQTRLPEAESKAALESKIDSGRAGGDKADTGQPKPESDNQMLKKRAAEKNYPPEAEAEAKLQHIEQKGTGPDRPIPDSEIVDKAGRDITVRTWDSGDHAYIRAYDNGKGEVPENVNLGTAGKTNVTLEKQADGATRARLNDIEMYDQYRGAGISSEMLGKAEHYARANNATEIYGSIDSEEARSFWTHMENKGEGWTIDPTKGYYGEVHKRLN